LDRDGNGSEPSIAKRLKITGPRSEESYEIAWSDSTLNRDVPEILLPS
jgi:hypothetical protein